VGRWEKIRSGFVALAGRPNVGKSTLVNAICGGKVAIVSDKPQTTRHRVKGVVDAEGYQLVLVDLPGFQRPRDTLTARMQRTVNQALEDVDGVCLVLAADERIGPGDRFVAGRVFRGGVPVVIALNKIDRLSPAEIARQIEAASALGDFRALHPVSAKTGDGIGALRRELFELLPVGPAYFPAGELTDTPLELRVAELVREQALALTREEIPHAVTVEVEELAGRRVAASVLVETDSQKQIVIGKGGRVIKEIGTRARPEIERLLGHPIFLELRVKVKPKWRRDERLLERLGL
jgi:GTP-binding protein Era